jgi:hypothetical protein|tara:strand:- start:626 stop:754 length:129 start_codon:yes stop_codon:yes gene_type:complete
LKSGVKLKKSERGLFHEKWMVWDREDTLFANEDMARGISGIF